VADAGGQRRSLDGGLEDAEQVARSNDLKWKAPLGSGTTPRET